VPRAVGDPIADFILHGKRGYCQHFATALALLARTAGVPARVVGGYRVVEVSPLGGYHVVRDRDAHAWVEAWLPGEGWRTFDATPAGGVPRRSSLLFALGDAATPELARGLAALRRMTLAQTSALVALAVALLAAVRAWNARRARKEPRRAAAATPACFRRLEAALRLTGHARAPSEPIERFARRIAVDAPEAAALAARWAAQRYGGIGDMVLLSQEMDACAARLSRGQARSA
jgi:hypothetical protein